MSIDAMNVTKQFGDFYALRDVSVSIDRGKLTALLGPSGGGKSTLLRIIAGLEKPDSGRVYIDGQDMTDVPARRRGIGFVFQHYAAFPHMTVWDNVAFGLRVAKADKVTTKRRVNELLDLVHLAGLSRRYPSELSGGQRQRMALAPGVGGGAPAVCLPEAVGGAAAADGTGSCVGVRASAVAARRAVRRARREGARRAAGVVAPFARA